jgi:hypothetical protein
MLLTTVLAAIAKASKPEPQYRYRLKALGYTSKTFGPCECCGGHVSDVWIQTEESRETDPRNGQTFWGVGESKFGHEECLMKARRA